MKMTTNSHLVPRLRMSGTMLLLPHTPSWCAQLQLCFYYHTSKIEANKAAEEPVFSKR
jgi:hypothetical protein